VASVLQRPFRSLILKCLIVILTLAALPRMARADDLTTVMPDGSTKAFPGVVVEKLQKDGSGKGWLLVRFGEGASHPVELTRVQSIAFGDAGAGRQYNISVGDSSRQEAFTGATFFRFQGGNFEAKPPEETAHYWLPPGRILTMELSQPLAPATGGAPAAPTPAAEDDLFANAPAGGAPDPFAAAGSADSSGGTAGYSGSSTPSPDDIEKLISPGVMLLLRIIQGLLSILSLTTTIWVCAHAISKGETTYAILTFCCCNILKYVYGFGKYDGAGKKVLVTLLIVELLLIVVFVGIAVSAGFSAAQMTSLK
jgi:hypothetical protein